jgi:hypothetical protein
VIGVVVVTTIKLLLLYSCCNWIKRLLLFLRALEVVLYSVKLDQSPVPSCTMSKTVLITGASRGVGAASKI